MRLIEERAPSDEQRRRFVALLDRLGPEPGRFASEPWPGLSCFRSGCPTPPEPTVYAPSLCIVGQGAKTASLGDRAYRYDPFNYLVIGAHMPVRAWVIEATDAEPYLSLRLELDPAAVHEIVLELDEEGDGAPRWEDGPPLRVSRLDARLLDAVLRLLESVEDPLDRRVLAPAAMREVIYLALRRDQGDLIRLAAARDGRSTGVARALHFIHRNIGERLDVPTIARESGMSTSTLHHNFKAATTMTPVQYIKRMRLNRARQLMLDEGCLAAEAAFRVGYESASQFSREFKQLFGSPPRQYVARLGAPASPTASLAARV
jgi:AraC-like DNA-binding protein